MCSQSTPRPPPAALLFAQLGDASPSAGHPMRAHIVLRRGQVAEHGRTPAVAARMPPAVLPVINLRIGTAAGCCCRSSSSLLLPHKSSQRRSEACRNRVVLSLLRLSAFKPIDRSWMVARVSLRRVQLATCDDMGRACARVLWSKQRDKGVSDAICHVILSPSGSTRVLPVMCPNAPAVFRHIPPSETRRL